MTDQNSSDIHKSELQKFKGLQVNIVLKIIFANISSEDIIYKAAYFQSYTAVLIQESELNDTLKQDFDEIINKIGNWISEGSGWRIESVDAHYINSFKYSPLAGSSYLELQEELRHPRK